MPWNAEQGRTILLRAALVVPLLATGGAAPDPDRVSAEDWSRGPDQPPNRIHYLTTHVWERRGSRWVLAHTHHSHLP